MRRAIGSIIVLFLTAGVLAGCSAASDSTSGSQSDSAAEGAASASDEQVAVGGAKDGSVAAAAQNRQVVTVGSVGIVVADPAKAAQRASEIVESAGGRVDDREEHAASEDSQASARLVVRIPSDRLTGTLGLIKELGDVERVQQTSTDVTDAANDLDARIRALTVSVGRLETLMGTAGSSDDLLALESTLSSRQGDLEALQAQRAGLAGQVALATVTIDLVPVPTVATAGPSGFWSGLGTGWRSLVVTLSGLLIAFGVLLPWLAFAGVLAAAAVALTRLVRSRRPLKVTAPSAAQLLGQPDASDGLGGGGRGAGHAGWSQGDSNP